MTGLGLDFSSSWRSSMARVDFLGDTELLPAAGNPLAEVDDLVRTWSWGLGITKRDTFPADDDLGTFWFTLSFEFPLADFPGVAGVSLIPPLASKSTSAADSR